jgi:hypothetical protein
VEEGMIVLGVLSVVSLGALSAYVLRYKCSGEHLGFCLFCVCFIYNIFFVTYYMRVIERSYFLFFGSFPDFLHDNPIVGWAALIGIVLHCGALPSKEKPKRFLIFKRRD